MNAAVRSPAIAVGGAHWDGGCAKVGVRLICLAFLGVFLPAVAGSLLEEARR